MNPDDTKAESATTGDASPVPAPPEGVVNDAAPALAAGRDEVDGSIPQRRWMIACLALLAGGGAVWGYRRWSRSGRRQPPGTGGGANGGAGNNVALAMERAPAANDAVLALVTPLREGEAIANGRVTRITGVYNGAVFVSVQAGAQAFVLTVSRAEAELNSMRAGPYALDLVSGPPGPVALQLSQALLRVLQANVRVPVPAGMTVR